MVGKQEEWFEMEQKPGNAGESVYCIPILFYKCPDKLRFFPLRIPDVRLALVQETDFLLCQNGNHRDILTSIQQHIHKHSDSDYSYQLG